MANDIEKQLNCNEEFRKHIKDFIEVFVDYYGEEQREYIEERFNSALLIGYLTEGNFNNNIHKLEQIESEKLFSRIISKTNINATEKQLFGTPSGKECYSFEYRNLHPIYSLKKFYDEFTLGEEKRLKSYYENSYASLIRYVPKISFEEYMYMIENKTVPEKYQKLDDKAKNWLLEFTDISPNIKDYERKTKKATAFLQSLGYNVTPENIEIGLLLDEYNNCLNEYDTVFKAKYSKYYDILKYNEDLENNLNNRYYTEFLKEIMHMLPEKYIPEITDYLEGKNKYLNYEVQNIIGHSLSSGTSLYDYFSKESTDKLNDENTDNWEKDKIKKNRMKYFKLLGYDFVDNYNEYLKHDDIWPGTTEIENFIEKRNKFNDAFNRDYYNNIRPQKDRIDEAKERGFLEFDPNDSAMAYMKTSGLTYVSPNITKNDDGYSIAAKVVISFDDKDTQDHFIIHELNHLYELSLVEVDEEKQEYTSISGWDNLNGKIGEPKEIDDINLNVEHRSYELFNEIINEKIAKDISKIMVEKNIEIFGKATKESYIHTTSYDTTNFLVDDFFNKYKKEILESRRDNNNDYIYNAVGRENFDALNQLFIEYDNNFSSITYYNARLNLKKGIKNEDTKLIQQLETKRNSILQEMDNYYTNIYLKSTDRPTPSDLKKSISN